MTTIEQTPCIYGLKKQVYIQNKKQSRCLVAQSSSERNRFFVGSMGLKHENELHLLDFDEDYHEITSINCLLNTRSRI
jgi:hypothetical protein